MIRAPFAGWVSLRNISVGAIAGQGTEIATVSDLSTIKLDFTVPETMLAAIREGLTIDARAAAYPDRPFNGTIRTIDPVIDPNTRAVTVRALLPNPDRMLRPGMMMRVAHPEREPHRSVGARARRARRGRRPATCSRSARAAASAGCRCGPARISAAGSRSSPACGPASGW